MSLGFLDFAAGASALFSSGASAFSTIYGTIEGTALAEKQQKLQGEILNKKAGLENQILNVQKNIFLDQQDNAKKSNQIDLQIKQARADLEIQKIKNEFTSISSNNSSIGVKSTNNINNNINTSNNSYLLIGGIILIVSTTLLLRKKL
ncbi:hypothetical protein [Candidatus Uabimicrobium sp. HlEnr_7]|uniref:hypothetical protein n=1 Tax=Candidatus Uabimicrobium helgolandensis TaxID=3095367 RepID=UPI003558D628